MLTTAKKQAYNNKFTTLSMSSRQSATSFLREFNISKRNAEEAGFKYSNGQLVDMLLAAITKSENPKYTVQAALYTAERARKTSLSFQYIEQTFLSLDFNLEKGPQKIKLRISKHQAKLSSHTSVDTPSNKIGKFKGKKFKGKSKPRRGPTACFACGETSHIVPNCPHKEKKEAWFAKRAERLNKKASPAKLNTEEKIEQCCMARIIFCDGTDVSDDDQLYLSDEELSPRPTPSGVRRLHCYACQHGHPGFQCRESQSEHQENQQAQLQAPDDYNSDDDSHDTFASLDFNRYEESKRAEQSRIQDTTVTEVRNNTPPTQLGTNQATFETEAREWRRRHANQEWTPERIANSNPEELTIDDLLSEEWFYGNPLNAAAHNSELIHQENSQNPDDISTASECNIP